MSSGFLALMAFAPILLAGILLIGLRWPARRAMPRPSPLTRLAYLPLLAKSRLVADSRQTLGRGNR